MEQKQRHKVIFSYSLAHLNQNQKVRFIRGLYGYKDKKGEKTYSHKGLIHELKGQKLGINVVMFDFENFVKVSDFFNKNNIRPEHTEVYMK